MENLSRVFEKQQQQKNKKHTHTHTHTHTLTHEEIEFHNSIQD